MYKQLIFSVFCLALITSCGPDNNADAEAAQALADSLRADSIAAAEAMNAGASQNFETKVLNDSIPSHRMELTGTVMGAPVTINYGSPAVNGRAVFGTLVPYGEVWRTGANEATTVTFGSDVVVGADKQAVPAGTYALYTIPAEQGDWTVIFNKKSDQWGSNGYDEKADAARIAAPAMAATATAERMTFELDDANIKLMWADRVVAIPVAPASK